LQSQNALFVNGNYLFTVNPLSNSVSIFWINPANATDVVLLNTASSGFDWPLSVTAWGGYAAVVGSGANNGLRVFTYNSTGLFVLEGSDRAFGYNLTTPPVSHTGPAQVSFLSDGTGLLISIKNNAPSAILYGFSSGVVGTTPINSTTQGNVPFGFAFDTDGTVVLTDAAPYGVYSGVQLLSVSGTLGTINWLLPNYFNISGQEASCWIAKSPSTNHFYIANVASQSITDLSRSGTTLTVNTNIGVGAGSSPTDLVAATIGAADYLFVQSAGTTVYVYSLPTLLFLYQLPLNNIGNYGGGVALYVPAVITTTTTANTTTTGTASLTSGTSGSVSTAASTTHTSSSTTHTTSSTTHTTATAGTTGTTSSASSLSANFVLICSLIYTMKLIL